MACSRALQSKVIHSVVLVLHIPDTPRCTDYPIAGSMATYPYLIPRYGGDGLVRQP